MSRIIAAVGNIRRRFDRRRERRYQREAAAGRPLVRAELRGLFEQLGITSGDRIMVHAHTAILGRCEGGFMAPVNLLQERIGKSGTLLMPTFPYRGSYWNYANTNPIFDVDKTPSQMGLMSEFFRRLPGVCRSVHPTHPVAIWGRNASDWAQCHKDHPIPFHTQSPFGHLHRAGGKILFMDLDGWHLTQIHVVEGLMAENFPSAIYLPELRRMEVIDHDRRQFKVPVLIHDPRQTHRIDARYFYSDMEKKGIVIRRKLRGYIPFVLVDAAAMANYFVDLAQNGVTYCDRTSINGRIRGLVAALSTDAPKAQRLSSTSTSSAR